MIKRYGWVHMFGGAELPDGPWVSYADHIAAVAALEKQRAAIWRDCIQRFEGAEKSEADTDARDEAVSTTMEKLSEDVLFLTGRLMEMRVALEWYGENARLCRLIHSGGDPGRHALSADGGKRAKAVLQGSDDTGGSPA